MKRKRVFLPVTVIILFILFSFTRAEERVLSIDIFYTEWGTKRMIPVSEKWLSEQKKYLICTISERAFIDSVNSTINSLILNNDDYFDDNRLVMVFKSGYSENKLSFNSDRQIRYKGKVYQYSGEIINLINNYLRIKTPEKVISEY